MEALMDGSMELTAEEVEAEARVRQARTRKALLSASSLAWHLRAQLTPADGRTELTRADARSERGAIGAHPTPLLTGVADAADELYVLLHSWAEAWASTLQVPPPAAPMWRNYQDSHQSDGYTDYQALGFRAGTSPGQAALLVSDVTAWLLWLDARIVLQLDAENYQDDVSSLVWRLRAASGLITPRNDTAIWGTLNARPCPVCKQFTVRAEFFGEPIRAAEARGEFDVHWASDVDERRNPNTVAGRRLLAAISGVEVRCAHCHWTEHPTASKIARWLS